MVTGEDWERGNWKQDQHQAKEKDDTPNALWSSNNFSQRPATGSFKEKDCPMLAYEKEAEFCSKETKVRPRNCTAAGA